MFVNNMRIKERKMNKVLVVTIDLPTFNTTIIELTAFNTVKISILI